MFDHILIASFGTGVASARASLDAVEQALARQAGLPHTCAFTSEAVRSILARRGESVPSAAQALEALGEEAAQRAADGWPDVRAVCGQLLEEGGVQAASGLLADAGEPNAHDAYTPARCEPVLRALDAALGA